jgi:hypothetical protein
LGFNWVAYWASTKSPNPKKKNNKKKAQTQKKKKKKKIVRGFGHFGGSKGILVIFLSFNCFFIIL